MVSANQRAIEAARSRLILNQRAQQQLAARRPPVLRRPVARGDGLDRLRAAARASAPQQQGRTDPKPGGLLGGILSNPVARAVLKPLEALDTPRRFVISGINEIADGFNGGDASWREFVDQASDPSFGFGDVVGETGNKWLDRAIGFAGDVAFDPLTYLTLGAGKLAGAGGRSAAAAQLASKGAGEEVVQRAGRLGVNALSGAERGLIGLDRAGMRFMGRRIGGQGDNVVSRVNEAVGSGIGTGLAQARAAVRSTGPGSAVARRLTRPAELTDEFEKLATGRGELSAIDAANNIASDAAEKATAGRFHAAHATPIDVIARKHRGDDRINLTHNIEAGLPGEYEDLARQTLRTVREDLNQTGIQLGDLGGNYLPHRETKEGAEWLGRVQPDFAKSNLTGAVRAQKERQWKVGETVTIDGKSAVITDDTIKGLNDFFKREFGAPAKVYEDDFVKLMDRYMNEVSTAAGRQARVSRLVEGGSAVELPNTLNEPLAPDVARSVAASAPDQLRAQLDRKATNAARSGVIDEAKAYRERLLDHALDGVQLSERQLGKVRRRAGRLGSTAERARRRVERTAIGLDREVGEAVGRRAGLASQLDAVLGMRQEQLALPPGPVPLVAEVVPPTTAPTVDPSVWERYMDRAPDDNFAGPTRTDYEITSAIYGIEDALVDQVDDEFLDRLEGLRDLTESQLDQFVNEVGDMLPPEFHQFWNLRQNNPKALPSGDVAAEQVVSPPGPAQSAGPMQSSPRPDRRAMLAAGEEAIESLDARIAALRPQQMDAGVARSIADQRVAALRQAANLRFNTGRYRRPDRVRKALNEEADELASLLDDANLDPTDPIVAETRALVAEAAERIGATNDLFDAAAKKKNFINEVKADPMYAAMMRVELRNGWERIGEELLKGGDAVAVRSDLAARLKRVDNAVQSSDFWKPIEAYTRFFKSYATATPGFHVRNGMSATFMNFADDVKAVNQVDGWRYWARYEKNAEGFLNSVPAKDRQLLDDALQAVYGSGGGRGQFSVEELGSRGNRLVDNPLTRTSKKIGGYVEGGARLGMALDTLRKGGTVEDAIARITRIHFNYSDVGSIDRMARRFIPFWTFMSRNLPLQVQQMWLKPRTYAHYNSLVRNLRDEEGEADDIIPLSWRRMGGFKLPEIGGQDNVYLAPDLPMNRLFEQVEDFGSTRMLASANPLLRMPLEFMQGEQFFSGRRFEDDQFEKMDGELTPFGPLAAALTPWAEDTEEGVVADERLTYALRNLMPLLGQMQRIMPTDEYYDDRDVSSRLGYAGIPIKTLTDRQAESEARRRRFEGQRADPNIARQEALRRFLAEN